MRNWGRRDAEKLRARTEGVRTALGHAGGPDVLLASAWRLFSASYPARGGAEDWNASAWRSAWAELPDYYAFGEDVFGNALALLPGHDNACLIDHESGEIHDLLLDPVSLLEICARDGVGWVDFYSADALGVAEAMGPTLDPEHHLHWVTPLVLGGKTQRSNVATLHREQHMTGHADLWQRIRDLPPGARVVLAP